MFPNFEHTALTSSFTKFWNCFKSRMVIYYYYYFYYRLWPMTQILLANDTEHFALGKRLRAKHTLNFSFTIAYGQWQKFFWQMIQSTLHWANAFGPNIHWTLVSQSLMANDKNSSGKWYRALCIGQTPSGQTYIEL